MTQKNAIQEKIDSNSEAIKEDLDKILGDYISVISIIEMVINDAEFKNNFVEFLEKFQFVTNFPYEEKLDNFIEKKLGEEFNLSIANLFGAFFEKEMLAFLKSWNKGKATFYTEKEAKRFFKEMKGQINTLITSGISIPYSEKLNEFGISFTKNNLKSLSGKLNEFLNITQKSEQIFYLHTKSPLLSAIKVLQILKENERYKRQDSYIFMDIGSLLLQRIQAYTKDAFDRKGTHNLLVINLEESQLELFPKSFVEGLHDKSKKIIFIAKNLKLSSSESNYRETTDEIVKFESLTPESQAKIFETEINLQGSSMSLSKLIDIEYGGDIFDEEIITRFLDTREISIGKEDVFYSKDYCEIKRITFVTPDFSVPFPKLG